MDLSALILTCSLYADDGLVRALVHVQSHDNPFHVADARMFVAPVYPSELEEGVRAIAALPADSEPLLGLLSVPAREGARFGRSPRELLDSCTNIAVGTALLDELAAGCRRRSADAGAVPADRFCVLRRYEGLLGLPGLSEAVRTALDFSRRHRPSDAVLEPPARAVVSTGLDGTGGWTGVSLFFDLDEPTNPERPTPPATVDGGTRPEGAPHGLPLERTTPPLPTGIGIREPRPPTPASSSPPGPSSP